MGTTLSLLLFCEDTVFVGHVGDGRIYLFLKNKAHQITEDHSLVNEMVKQGMISKEEAKIHPRRNVITRAVGIQEAVQAELAEKYIELCNKRGGKDNITSLVIDVESDDEVTDDEKSDLINKKIDTLSHIPLFENFKYQELIKVLEIIKVKTFTEGKEIITEGDMGEVMYVILQGAAQVSKQGHEINVLHDGAFFGEMSLIDKVPRSATVTAKTKVRCLMLERKPFFTLLQQDARLSSKVFWSFVQTLNFRLRMKEDELAILRTKKDKSAV